MAHASGRVSTSSSTAASIWALHKVPAAQRFVSTFVPRFKAPQLAASTLQCSEASRRQATHSAAPAAAACMRDARLPHAGARW